MIQNSTISQFFHAVIKMLILNLIRCLCLFDLICFDSSTEGFQIGLFLNLILINLDLVFILFFLILLLIFFLILNLFHLNFLLLFYLYYLYFLVTLLVPLLFFILVLFHYSKYFFPIYFYQLIPKEQVKQTLINLFFIFINFLNQNLNFLHYYFFFINNFWFFGSYLCFPAILFFTFKHRQL